MTTEELFKFYAELCSFEEGPAEYLIDKESFVEALKKFALFHVKEALEKATEKARIIPDPNSYCGNTGSEYPPDDMVDKKSIIECYPENLIL